MSAFPELLYHTTLTVVDYHADKSGSSRTVYVLGTRTSVQAAKAFAVTALNALGYEPSDFAIYDVNDGSSKPWTHGDGVIVFAKAPAGQEFLVGIDTKPNDQEYSQGPNDTIMFSPYPEDNKGNPDDLLHYVLQTKFDYEQDRSGSIQTTEIEGAYLHRQAAIDAAKKCLKNTGDEFVEYDEQDSPKQTGEWPYGEDVLIHAVSQTGENYTVAVRTIPGAHEKHHKKHANKN